MTSNFILNPETNRSIRIGGRQWLKLVKKGVLARDNYRHPNTAYELNPEDYEDIEDPQIREEEKKYDLMVEKQRMIDNDEVPNGFNAILSKNSKIVYQKPKMNTVQSSKLTADAALEVIDDVQNNQIDIPDDMSKEQARDYLQNLIFNKMISSKKKFRDKAVEEHPHTPVRRVKKIPTQKVRKIPIPQKVRRRPTLTKPRLRRSPPLRKKEQVYFVEEAASEADNEQTETEYEYIEVDDDRAFRKISGENSSDYPTETETETEYEYY